MKDRTKNTPQVLLRRALLVLLDAAIVAFSFYFALLLRADGAVEAVWWPHNRALLYENLPWIVAVYIVSFLLGGLFSRLRGSRCRISSLDFSPLCSNNRLGIRVSHEGLIMRTIGYRGGWCLGIRISAFSGMAAYNGGSVSSGCRG